MRLIGLVVKVAVDQGSASDGYLTRTLQRPGHSVKKVRRHMLRARKRKGFGWTHGVGSGCTKTCDRSMVTGFADRCRKSRRQDRSHKPCGEAKRRA